MDVDAFIDETLERGFRRPPPDNCPSCNQLWHGLSTPGCPGPWALDIESVQNQGCIEWVES